MNNIRRIRTLDELGIKTVIQRIPPHSMSRQSYKNRKYDGKCMSCNNRQGRERIDNSLKCGIHCDDCWNKMYVECRSRSW